MGHASRRSISKSILVRLIAPGLALFVVLAFPVGCSKGPPQAPPPPVVEVVDVVQKDVPTVHEWIGTADGIVNATIRAQVQGYLISQKYKDGDYVKKGQILFEIDPRSFQAAVEQAQGQLEQQKARWVTSKANLDRTIPLARDNAVSKKDLDDATGSELAAKAAVLSAQAALDKAKLDLGFTRITSPINGIAGSAKAQIGNLVGPGTTEELTTVSTVDPIKVYISLSEQEMLRAIERQKSRKIAAGEGAKNIQLFLADGTLYPHPGKFDFADRQVDPKTGTIRAAATFANPGNYLRPGLYGKVRAVIGVRSNALLVPQRSITELQGQYMVAVVGPDNKVEIRPVKLAEASGNMRVVEQGVKPGEKIVVAGTQKVRNGITVSPTPFTEEKAAADAPAQAPAKPEAAAPEKTQAQPTAAKPETKPAEKPDKPAAAKDKKG